MNTETSTREIPARRRRFMQPAFVAAVVVLGAAAVGVNAATQAMKVHFKKEAVPLRHQLDDPGTGVASKLGPWVKATEQVTLDPDLQHALGTDRFVFRNYVDTRVVDPARVAELKDKSQEEQERLLGAIRAEHPEAVLNFAVTYYTGLVDRVAHVPDRCMVAGGYEPTSYEVLPQSFAMPDGTTRDLQMRFINFEDQTGSRLVPTRVAYFFHSNGGYEDDHVAVRYRLQNLFERHGYYAKIELMSVDPNGGKDTAASLKSMTDFLSHALPEVERCLPDWQAVKAAAAVAQK